MPWARPSEMELNSCASLFPYIQSTSRRLGPMPPPPRPPWQPEQLKRTNSWRPAPIAARSPPNGLAIVGGFVGGPGMGPTAVVAGGVVEMAGVSGGVPPHATTVVAAAAAANTMTPFTIDLIREVHQSPRESV